LRKADSNHRFRVTRPSFRWRLMSLMLGSPHAESRREREPTPRGCRAPPAEPMVRIPSPPAESPSLSRSCFRRSRTPAFRAAVRGWLGDRVGRDTQGVTRSRQPAAISLSRHIPVPQCPLMGSARMPCRSQ
jgi:hypothetical protein